MSGPSVVPKGEGWIAKELQSIRRDMREQLASQAAAFNTTVATLNAAVQAIPVVRTYSKTVSPVTVDQYGVIVSVSVPHEQGKTKANYMASVTGGIYRTASTSSPPTMVLGFADEANQAPWNASPSFRGVDIYGNGNSDVQWSGSFSAVPTGAFGFGVLQLDLGGPLDPMSWLCLSVTVVWTN